MKLTGWYRPDQKPVRVGVYERKLPNNFGPFQHWNGKFWGGWCNEIEGAKNNANFESRIQTACWRGIAK